MTTPHAILLALDRVQPLLLPENSLHVDVSMLLPAPPTHSELQTHLTQLQQKQWILSTQEPLTGALKWRITTAGRSILAEMTHN